MLQFFDKSEDNYGGYIGLGGSVPAAPTETAIPAPSSLGIDYKPGTGPVIILPPPGGGYPDAPPPIIPGQTESGGIPSACSTCKFGPAPTPVGEPVLKMPTLALPSEGAALNAKLAPDAPAPTSATPSISPWWWLLAALALGYVAGRD